jgi:hypothetical protein
VGPKKSSRISSDGCKKRPSIGVAVKTPEKQSTVSYEYVMDYQAALRVPVKTPKR